MALVMSSRAGRYMSESSETESHERTKEDAAAESSSRRKRRRLQREPEVFWSTQEDTTVRSRSSGFPLPGFDARSVSNLRLSHSLSTYASPPPALRPKRPPHLDPPVFHEPPALRNPCSSVEANTLSLYNYQLQLLRKDSARVSEKIRRSRIMETWEYGKLGSSETSECRGDMIVRKMEEAYAFFSAHGFPLSPQQLVMAKAGLCISYGQYYGKSDLRQNLVRLLKASGWSELRAEMIVLAPRRFGKTFLISMLGAAETVVVPGGHDVSVYSNNGRASKMLLLTTYKFTKMLSSDPSFGGKIISLNKTEVMQFQTKYGTINDFYAYPAKPDNLRGTGSKKATGTVIAEEFAYMNLKVVYEIVAPTLTRENVKFIGITTVSDANSFVTPLAEAKFPDGRSVILTLNFELVCEDCKAAGIPEKCKCLMADIPHWQSSTQHSKLEIIMSDHVDTYLKELKGFQADASVTPAFNPQAVNFLNSSESVIMRKDVVAGRIFCAIDPACGGDYSKFAIVSAIFDQYKMIIVGVESFSVSGGLHAPTHQINLIKEHFKKLRMIPGLQMARIILVPESNYAWESQHYGLAIIDAQIPHVYLMAEDEKQQGMRTSNSSKKLMAVLFNRALNCHSIKFHPLLASVSKAENPQEMRQLIIKQLGQYKRKIIMKKGDASEYEKPTEIYTGKIGGHADDHAVMAQLCYMSHNIYRNKFEEKYRNQDPLWHERIKEIP